MTASIRAVTLAERPDFEPLFSRFHRDGWPTFMLHDPVSNRAWGSLYSRYGHFQLLLLDGEEVVAIGNTMPVRWDGTVEDLPHGVDGVLERTVDRSQHPSVLSAMAAIVSPAHRGRGLSALILREMRRLADDNSLGCLIAPVRPTLKERYPLTLMERYMAWRLSDRSHFDPWLRIHERLGARIVSVAEQSMRVVGTVAEWEEWAGMAFPETGPYVVPGALSPVHIDTESNQGDYVEQNVWMVHQ